MNAFELAFYGAAIGIAGTATIDAWSLFLRRMFGVSTLDYALLGRWIGHMRRGQFRHTRMAATPAIPGERLLGWISHYAIGIGFAVLLLAIWGESWTESPTLFPAMLTGLGSMVAPWFVMQPAFGAGWAGSRTPHPWAGRARNLGTHAVYGLGLYASAVLITAL